MQFSSKMTPASTYLFSKQHMYFKKDKVNFILSTRTVCESTLSSLTETPLSLHTRQYWRSLIIVLIISQDLLLSFFLLNHRLTLLTMHHILHMCFSEINYKTPSCLHQVSSHLQVLCYLFMNNPFSRSHLFIHSDHSIVQLLLSIPRWHLHSLF